MEYLTMVIAVIQSPAYPWGLMLTVGTLGIILGMFNEANS